MFIVQLLECSEATWDQRGDHLGAFVELVTVLPQFKLQLIEQEGLPTARNPIYTHDNGFKVIGNGVGFGPGELD
jgi:hypothetical protein